MECNHADVTGTSQSKDLVKSQITAVGDEKSRHGEPPTAYLDT